MNKIYFICCVSLFTILLFSHDLLGKNDVDKDVIKLSNRREIFVDHYLIDQLHNATIMMHKPIDRGVVFKFDEPWEGPFSTYITVIKDDSLYRTYYRGNRKGSHDGTNYEVTCYAESKDGINWDKPHLKLFERNGTYNNNIVLADEAPVNHNFCPFIDLNPEALSLQKYKALGGTGKQGLIPYVSSDGIHWKRMHDSAVITDGGFDSQNVAFWSETEDCYVCYFRIKNNGYRSVGRATSKDFIHWSETEKMTFGNTPWEHMYIQQTSPYFRAPHIYVAIGARFMSGRQILTEEQAKKLGVDPAYFKDCMTSRGGNEYDRTFMESFIRPGIGLNNWVSRTNYPALNVVQTSPTEMSIYVGEDYAQSTAHLHRYSLRLDGFTSLSTPYKGGEITTKLFTFSGNELEINYSTSAAGEIKIEWKTHSQFHTE